MTQRHRELVKAGDLFAKYRAVIKAPERSVVDVALEVVFDVTNIKLTSKQCGYKVTTRTLVLKTPSLIKHEIQHHKEEILLHIKGRLGEQNSPHHLI